MARLGMNAKAYRNSGTFGSPTWVELTNIRDANLADGMAEADVTRRASGGFREVEPTLREISYEYDAVNIASDADLTALLAAYNGRTAIDIQILDGPIATPGSSGVRARFKVFKRDRGEELENAQMISFTLKPCRDGNAPAEVTMV